MPSTSTAGESAEAAATATSDEQLDLDRLLDLDLEQLGDVKVRPETSQQLDAPSSSLSIDDYDFSNATTPGELLEKSTSVNVRRTSSLNLNTTLRGYQPSQINSTANGMNQLKARFDIDSVFSQIDPGIIESVAIIDGPYSSLYGPGFAFIAAETIGNLPSDSGASLGSYYGSNGATLYTRESGWYSDDRGSAYVSHGLRTGNDYTTGGSNGFEIPSSYNKQDFYTELKLKIDDQSRIEFNYLNTQINALELPGIVYDLKNSTNNQFNLRYVIQEDPEGVEQFVLQAWSSQTVYSGDSTSSSKQRTFFEDFLTPTSIGREVVSTFGSGSMRTRGARALATFGDIDNQTLTIGADWRAYTQRYQELDFTSSGDLAFDGNIFGIPHSTQNDFGLLAHSVLLASDLWTFTMGGRLDCVFSSVNADDSIVTAINPAGSLYYYPGLEERAHLLGMSYLTASRDVTDSLKINGAVAFAMRPPSLPELYQDEPYEPTYRFGNSFTDGLSTLDPERNFQLDLGFTETREAIQFGGRAFHSEIRDYIMAVPSSIYVIEPPALTGTGLGRDFSQFPISTREDITSGFPNADGAAAGYRYVNLDRVEIWGTDGFLEIQPRDGMSMRGTISYVQGINHSPSQTTYYDDPTLISLGSSEPLPYIYPLNGTVTTRIFDDEMDRWSISLITRLVATQNRVAKSVAELPTDGFVVLSLRSYVRPTKNWKLSLALENFLDTNYRQHDSLAIVAPNGLPTFLQEPGISVIVGSEITF